MSRAPLGWIFFSSAYILLAIGFLTIHYTGEKHFSNLVGEIEVRGKSTVGTVFSPPKIRKLVVAAAGLELLFNKLNTAVLTTEDGIRHRLVVDDWSEGDNLVSIFLSDGAIIKVSSSGYDGAFSLSTVIPATIPPVKSFEFPLQPTSDADVRVSQNNVLAIKTDNTEYMLTLPPNSLWDRKLRRLVVSTEIDPALLGLHQKVGISAIEWLNQGNLPSEAVFNGVISRWNADARRGWGSRTIPGSWDDELAAVMLVDALQTEQLEVQISSVKSVAQNSPEAVGWLPSPIMGGIVRGGQMHIQALKTAAGSILSELKGKQLSFPMNFSLSSLYDLGFKSEAAHLLRLVRQNLPPQTSNKEALR